MCMSEYIDETPLTQEEIEEAIRAAKRAKAAKKKQQTASEAAGKESAEDVFNEIDSAVKKDDEEELSPKMKSAKSFQNAFAAAKIKREEDLKKKKTEKQEKQKPEQAEEEFADELDEDFEEEFASEFEADEPAQEKQEDVPAEEKTEENEEENIENSDFDVDDEDYEEYDEGSDEYEEIFEPDDESAGAFVGKANIADSDDEQDDEDEEDDDDDAFSTKTKVIIGIIIAILVALIIGAGIYFYAHKDQGQPEPAVSSAVDENGVKSIKFPESSISLRVGESVSLDIIIEPESAQDKVLKLKSNDPSIAKVDEQGRVTGVSSGSTTITATLKSNETVTASLIVNVIDEKQNAINVYNKFINSILDGSTDIDSTDSEEPEEENDEDSDSESDTDTEETKTVVKNTLTGSIIRDLNSDGDLELALYYHRDNDEDNVRIFYLAEEGKEEETEEETEPQYDEESNLIESDSDTATDTDSDAAPKEKILTEADLYSEMYSVCYSTIEQDATGWDTCFVEVKEDEVAKARVTILSEDYSAPTYVYESEDETVATVDNQGNIKGIKPGVTFVTVTSPLNSEAIAKIKVKVKDDTDMLDEYLANIPKVQSTNDSVISTITLTGKAIVDIDNDGMSELILRYNYGGNVETISIVKVENEKCVEYKTYNNLSDLYEYYEDNGSYKNSILIHYTTGAVNLEYRATVSKKDSKTRTSEQRIFSLENNGSLSELINFTTTTDVSTKTVTSEVVVNDESTVTSSRILDDSEEETDTTYYDPDDSEEDSESYEDSEEDQELDNDYGYEEAYARLSFEDIVKKADQLSGDEDDEDEDDYDYDYDNNDNDNDNDNNDDDDEPVTSTVTTEITEETTKYFVNGSPVEQSVYEEFLSTWAARFSVWNAWESV